MDVMIIVVIVVVLGVFVGYVKFVDRKGCANIEEALARLSQETCDDLKENCINDFNQKKLTWT